MIKKLSLPILDHCCGLKSLGIERELFDLKKGRIFERFDSMIKNECFRNLGLRRLQQKRVVRGIGYFVLAFCLFCGGEDKFEVGFGRLELRCLYGDESSPKLLFVDSIEGENDLFVVSDWFLGIF